MPPKKPQQANKKTEQKKKEKVIEDKTFGLKNKKGQKNQKYIQHVTKQVQHGNQKAARLDEMQQSKSKLKDEKKKEQEELNKLFKPVTAAQKVAKGVDPKSVLCAFYKQGQCKKGDKCKFSHDLTIQRKAEKKSMYEDERSEKEQDTMDNWDEAKLQDVVQQKHGEAEIKLSKTDKVCKFFLQAIEDCKYGWFWICPNGGDKCMYKHALPPGFVLKKNKKAEEDDEEKISLEELIEDERTKLASTNLTKLTLESFTAWKKRKISEKKKDFEETMTKKKNDFKQGRALGLSGREVFEFKPELAEADDEGADDTKYVREVDEDEEEEDAGPVMEITLEAMGCLATEVDNSGTISKSSERGEPVSATKGNSLPGASHMEDESSKLGMAGALPTSDVTQVNGVPIDEGIFDEEDVPVDEDLFTNELDDLDEDLDGIDLDD